MSSPYKEAAKPNPGRLIFKGGASASSSLDKKKTKKHKKKKPPLNSTAEDPTSGGSETAVPVSGEEEYTIDPMKKMKYEELFPVETRKFGYDAKKNDAKKSVKRSSVEEALDDRVKKKADRYCK